MTLGTPGMVRDLVLREYEVFRLRDGESRFYIEALIETIRGIR